MALERIKALWWPADPPGYELWYSHASKSKRNPEVNRAGLIASSARKGSRPLSMSTRSNDASQWENAAPRVSRCDQVCESQQPSAPIIVHTHSFVAQPSHDHA